MLENIGGACVRTFRHADTQDDYSRLGDPQFIKYRETGVSLGKGRPRIRCKAELTL